MLDRYRASGRLKCLIFVFCIANTQRKSEHRFLSGCSPGARMTPGGGHDNSNQIPTPGTASMSSNDKEDSSGILEIARLIQQHLPQATGVSDNVNQNVHSENIAQAIHNVKNKAQKVTPSGRVVKSLNDGTRITHWPNGNVDTIAPDGTKTTTYPQKGTPSRNLAVAKGGWKQRAGQKVVGTPGGQRPMVNQRQGDHRRNQSKTNTKCLIKESVLIPVFL